jgi:hypothetical protein
LWRLAGRAAANSRLIDLAGLCWSPVPDAEAMTASYCEMTMTLQRRNIQRRSIGIVAHVDAGKAAFAAGRPATAGAGDAGAGARMAVVISKRILRCFRFRICQILFKDLYVWQAQGSFTKQPVNPAAFHRLGW